MKQATLSSLNIEQEHGMGAMPHHVAIIMDGNGRWAKQQGFNRTNGHRKGAERIRGCCEACIKLGIEYLTLYAFSSENWRRPETEVTELMDLLRYYLRKKVSGLHKEQVRIQVIGDRQKLPEDIVEEIKKAEQLTQSNRNLTLTIALSYGARQEIMHAVKGIVHDIVNKQITQEDLSETLVREYLYTKALPDPDLLIRTGREQRLSNFLLWQLAYTELYFTPILWPDFTISDFNDAISHYQERERRYGS